MVMFLLSFVKGVQIRGGGQKSASGYGPRGSKSASGYGPGVSISASGFGRGGGGGPILGGSKSARTPAHHGTSPCNKSQGLVASCGLAIFASKSSLRDQL